MKSARRIALESLLPPLGFAVSSFWIVFAVGGASSRLAQSFHGLHHSAYVVEIVNGIIPPTNPLSLGMPANFYWAWHAFLALLCRVLGITPLEAGLSSNAIGLTLFLCGLWWASGRATRHPLLRLGATLLPFLLLNPVGLTQFSWKLLLVIVPDFLRSLGAGTPSGLDDWIVLARHHEALQIQGHSLTRLLPELALLEGVPLSTRAGGLMNKFYNFNSFPLAAGFFSCALALLCCRGPWGRSRLIGLSGCGLLCAFTSPLPALVIAIVVTSCCLFRALEPRAKNPENRDPADESPIHAARPVIAAALGMLLALPYLLSVGSAFGGETTIYTEWGQLWRHARYIGWAMAPSFVIALFSFVFWSRLDWVARGMAVSIVVLALLASLLSVPAKDPNEYKLAILAAPLASLLLLASWQILESRVTAVADPATRGRRLGLLRNGLALVAVTAGALAIGATSFLYLASPWSSSEPFGSDGGRVELLELEPGDARRERDQAYRWLRENTAVDAYVLEKPSEKEALELPLVAQRRVVASRPSAFTELIPHHAELVMASDRIVDSLASCTLEPDAIADFFALPAPWPPSLSVLVPLRGVAADPGCGGRALDGLALQWRNSRYAIYALERPSR